MIDYGFPLPLDKEDVKKSSKFMYAVAAIALGTYLIFGAYQLNLKNNKKDEVSRYDNLKTNILEDITIEGRK